MKTRTYFGIRRKNLILCPLLATMLKHTVINYTRYARKTLCIGSCLEGFSIF
jgi:hypothetical protein